MLLTAAVCSDVDDVGDADKMDAIEKNCCLFNVDDMRMEDFH